MAHHLIFLRYAVAAVHVARGPRDIERLADIVALDDRDHVGRGAAIVEQAADPQAGLQPQRDVGQHVGELPLVELVGGERLAELVPVEAVLPGGVHAELRRAERAPADAVARAVEAAERSFQPLYAGQQRVFAHLDIVHDDHAGGGCAQGKLALDLGR